MIKKQRYVNQWQHEINGKQQYIVSFRQKKYYPKKGTIEISKHYTHIQKYETISVSDPE